MSVQDVKEEAEQVVEETVEEVKEVLAKAGVNPALVGLLAFGAGAAIGFFLGKRMGKTVVIPAEPIERRVIIPEQGHPAYRDRETLETTPMATIRTEAATTGHFLKPTDPQDVIDIAVTKDGEDVATVSVFAASDDVWDWDEEKKLRNPRNPYVIHKDEYFEDSMDFAQVTITYYAGDNICAGEANEPIYNHGDILGELKFGHGSGDPKVVYIRNEKRRAEYEVLLDPGLYSVEVEGLEIEDNHRARDLRHSRPTRFPRD